MRLPTKATQKYDKKTRGPSGVGVRTAPYLPSNCRARPKRALSRILLVTQHDTRHPGPHLAGIGPVRIHLLRFTTLDAPKEVIETLGGVLKPMSQLRGSAMSGLLLLRAAFSLIVGGAGGG